jgi:hypothetical protein
MRGQYPRRYAVRITPVKRPSTSEAEARAKKVARYVEGIRRHQLDRLCHGKMPVESWTDDVWEKVRRYIEHRDAKTLHPASITTRVAIAAELQRLRVLDRQCGWCQQPIGDSDNTMESPVVGRVHMACWEAVRKELREAFRAQQRAER